MNAHLRRRFDATFPKLHLLVNLEGKIKRHTISFHSSWIAYKGLKRVYSHWSAVMTTQWHFFHRPLSTLIFISFNLNRWGTLKGVLERMQRAELNRLSAHQTSSVNVSREEEHTKRGAYTTASIRAIFSLCWNTFWQAPLWECLSVKQACRTGKMLCSWFWQCEMNYTPATRSLWSVEIPHFIWNWKSVLWNAWYTLYSFGLSQTKDDQCEAIMVISLVCSS